MVYWGSFMLGSVGLHFINSPKKLISKKHPMKFLIILIVVNVSPMKAAWRIAEQPFLDRSNSIVRLAVRMT